MYDRGRTHGAARCRARALCRATARPSRWAVADVVHDHHVKLVQSPDLPLRREIALGCQEVLHRLEGRHEQHRVAASPRHPGGDLGDGAPARGAQLRLSSIPSDCRRASTPSESLARSFTPQGTRTSRGRSSWSRGVPRTSTSRWTLGTPRWAGRAHPRDAVWRWSRCGRPRSERSASASRTHPRCAWSWPGRAGVGAAVVALRVHPALPLGRDGVTAPPHDPLARRVAPGVHVGPSGVHLGPPGREGSCGGFSVAVLSRTRREARFFRGALRQGTLPSPRPGSRSVFICKFGQIRNT